MDYFMQSSRKVVNRDLEKYLVQGHMATQGLSLTWNIGDTEACAGLWTACPGTSLQRRGGQASEGWVVTAI